MSPSIRKNKTHKYQPGTGSSLPKAIADYDQTREIAALLTHGRHCREAKWIMRIAARQLFHAWQETRSPSERRTIQRHAHARGVDVREMHDRERDAE